MSKNRKVSLLAIILAGSFTTGCSLGKDIVQDQISRVDNQVTLSDSDLQLLTTKSLNDEDILLQTMGEFRPDDIEILEKGVELGIINSVDQADNLITTEDFYKALDIISQNGYFSIDSSNFVLESDDDGHIKVSQLLTVMADILNSVYSQDTTSKLSNASFITLFSEKGNSLSQYSENFIEKLSYLRSLDALLINLDDTMIIENNISYGTLVNGVVRLLDLRIQQLITEYYPDECQTCSPIIDDWYVLIEQLPTETLQSETLDVTLGNNIDTQIASPKVKVTVADITVNASSNSTDNTASTNNENTTSETDTNNEN